MKTIAVLLLSISLASATTVNSMPRRTIVVHDNYIIATFTDNWVCYGTIKPLSVACRYAVPKPTYREIQ